MPISAIGTTLSTSSSDLTSQSLNINQYISLFMTELTYQDPLKPVDNTQFLAQLAQFASLEQESVASQNSGNMVTVGVTNQSLGLLGHTVQITTSSGTSVSGTVSSISLNSGSPTLTVSEAGGSVLTGISMSQITSIIK